MSDEEIYRQKMNKLVSEAHTEVSEYSNKKEPPLIAGKFTFKEMMEFRDFYKETGGLFVAPGPNLDPNEYYPDFNSNIREFFVFLLLPESDIPKFIFEKYCQTNFAK